MFGFKNRMIEKEIWDIHQRYEEWKANIIQQVNIALVKIETRLNLLESLLKIEKPKDEVK